MEKIFLKYERMLLIAALIACFFMFSASAEGSATEYDGFLFALKDGVDASAVSVDEKFELAVPGNDVYKAESLEDISKLVDAGMIEYAEPNCTVELFDSETGTEPETVWNIRMLGTETAWKYGLNGSGVRVGIIDSGIFPEHEQLQQTRIIPGHNYVNDSDDTSDDVGHGTFAAGIIAGGGGFGIATGAEIVPLKCFDTKTGQIDDIANAIYAGVDVYNCDILNMSFGVVRNFKTLSSAVEYANEKGVVMTAAVGNYSSTMLCYPAAYDCVIGVGNIDKDKVVSQSSQRNNSVFLSAPGCDIYGLGTDAADAYDTKSGTSFSCPHITAAAALIMQAVPDITADQLKEMLSETADDLGDEGYDTTYGFGLVSLTGILQSMPTEFSKDGSIFRIRRVSKENVGAAAAFFDENGRLLRCSMLNGYGTDGATVFNSTVEPPGDAKEVRLFIFDSSGFVPAANMESYEISLPYGQS